MFRAYLLYSHVGDGKWTEAEQVTLTQSPLLSSGGHGSGIDLLRTDRN